MIPIIKTDFEKLANLIFKDIVPKLENNQGLLIFAKERSKFEDWVKVELCETLSRYFSDVAPERKRIDITFDNWGIQLKTLNTNYQYKNVSKKTRPITNNVKGVIDDIDKLKFTDYSNNAVLFVVFPATHGNQRWQTHLKKISVLLKEIKYKEFKFKDKIPGVVYLGLI